MKTHALTDRIPDYLRPYIATQDPSLYTPLYHAGWRFILKISRAFFSDHAHQMYLDGLEKTGISSDRIPLIAEMDQKLQKFNWRAVPVCGFIPPSVFMEFLSLGILPIACDMRTAEHLSYTPAPDIVHEAAGHAPIIADPEYAEYLRQYGEISRKAIHSRQDWDVYVAIRNLSDSKEDPEATSERIASAQKQLDQALTRVDHVSEASQLARMSWWTIEYGLIGEMDNPKIYGAGLLSSVSESFHCLRGSVKKIPLTLSCIEMGYDITRPQPQLYVAKNFQAMTGILNELADTMAFRRGSIEGLERALKAGTVTTTVLDSGIQISGIVNRIHAEGNAVSGVEYGGPMQFAYGDLEHESFSPSGTMRGFFFERLPDTPMGAASIELGKGLTVFGRVTGKVSAQGSTLALILAEGSLSRNGNPVSRSGPLFLAAGRKVVSVFGGAADRPRYFLGLGESLQPPAKPKTNLTSGNRELNELYGRIRAAREKSSSSDQMRELTLVHDLLEAGYPEDWLLRYELLEYLHDRKLSAPWQEPTRKRLESWSRVSSAAGEMIQRGLDLLH